jgi:hypothetical protein
VYAIKDDHGFFSKHISNSPDVLCGKLFLVNSADTDVHHIFFDDNIKSDEAFIVDIWDMATKKRIPFKDALNIYMCQADTIQAMADNEYFVKKTKDCLSKRAQKIGLKLADCYVNDKHVKNKWYCVKSDKALPCEKQTDNIVYSKPRPRTIEMGEGHTDDPLAFLTTQLLETTGRRKKIRRY